jgi:arylsulfatase A-like enzyme
MEKMNIQLFISSVVRLPALRSSLLPRLTIALLSILGANLNLNGQSLIGTKPNIVFILADDLGYNDLGCFGSPYNQTPNIDRLSESGMKFTNAYVNAPNCAPSRACLMTGMFTPRHKMYTVSRADRGKASDRKLIPVKNIEVLDTAFYSLAEMLSDVGYDCANVGKWHIAADPKDYGFSLSVGGDHHGAVASHYDRYRKVLPGLEQEADTTFLADALTNKAIDFIRSNRDKPFFLYLPFYSVHTPVEAPAPLWEKYRKLIPPDSPYDPLYAAMVENLDQNVGRLIQALETRGKLNNTIIIFLSDNGPVLNYTSVQLRGEKGSLYEGGIREPLIISWKGTIAPGSINSAPVSAVDFYPTLAALAGHANLPKNLDGYSLLPLLEGKTRDHYPIIFHFPAYLETYNPERGLWRETPASAVRYGDWKYVVHYEDNKKELFNMVRDAKETLNVIAKNKKMADKLELMLQQYLRETNAFIPTELNTLYRPSK